MPRVGHRPAEAQPDSDRDAAHAERHARKLAAEGDAEYASSYQAGRDGVTKLMQDRPDRERSQEKGSKTYLS